MNAQAESPSWGDLLDAASVFLDGFAVAGPVMPGLLLCAPGLILFAAPVIVLGIALAVVTVVIAAAIAVLAIAVVVVTYPVRRMRRRSRPRPAAAITMSPATALEARHESRAA